jgi:phosphopantetheinyl transferase (holo-ACP synthase)
LDIARQMSARRFWLSLSHTDLYAIAQVILED